MARTKPQDKAPKEPAKILELNLTEDVPTEDAELGVKINGTFYPYANLNEWGLAKRNRFASIWRQMEALEKKENPTEADEERYDDLTSEFIRVCLPSIPEEVVQAMKASHRTAISLDFLMRCAARHPVFRTLAGFSSKIGTLLSPS